ncbi:MAG TPA: 3D domain-containing protein [Candidatus Bathyarchaeia archaeon]|nr:3D domain-containing protein [Candidatus Bathyarchaeia archaeon]
MRILATLILGTIVFSTVPAKAAGTNEVTNQDAKQISQFKKTNTFDDNFLVALYAPKVGVGQFSSMYKNRLFSENFVVPAESFIVNASAYTAAADECGKSDGITASGKKVQANHTLACPKQYKMGTKISIDGMGTYVCEDRGGAIKGNHFDIYMPTKAEAFAFGRRNLVAMVVE